MFDRLIFAGFVVKVLARGTAHAQSKVCFALAGALRSALSNTDSSTVHGNCWSVILSFQNVALFLRPAKSLLTSRQPQWLQWQGNLQTTQLSTLHLMTQCSPVPHACSRCSRHMWHPTAPTRARGCTCTHRPLILTLGAPDTCIEHLHGLEESDWFILSNKPEEHYAEEREQLNSTRTHLQTSAVRTWCSLP